MDELRRRCDPEQLRQMLNQYKEALRGIYSEDSGADLSGDVLEDVDYDVLEEMLADAYAGLNEHGAGANRLGETVRTWLRENHVEQDFFQDNGTEQPTGPPTGQKENTAEHGGDRYSADADQRSIRQQLRESLDILNKMDPVADVTVPESFWDLDIAGKKAWVIKKLQPTGFNVGRSGLGIIEFAKSQLKSAFNYFRIGSIEEAVFEALPHVLRNGVEITYRDNHKGREYDTITIAAPVTINGKRGNMAASVKQTTGYKYKVHRVLSPDGSVFDLSKMEEAEPTPGGGVVVNDSLATPISSASNSTVSHRIQEVKQQIRAVLDKVSPNHAAQMESYTVNKVSNPELAQKLYDGLMDSPYSVQFEEYLKLTEELAGLDSEGSAITDPENDKTGAGFMDRTSVDDSVAEEERKDSYSTLPAKARDYVRSAERNLLDFIGQALSVPKTARRDFLAQVVRAITNEYLQTGRVSQETIDGLFQQAYAQGVVADEE